MNLLPQYLFASLPVAQSTLAMGDSDDHDLVVADDPKVEKIRETSRLLPTDVVHRRRATPWVGGRFDVVHCRPHRRSVVRLSDCGADTSFALCDTRRPRGDERTGTRQSVLLISQICPRDQACVALAWGCSALDGAVRPESRLHAACRPVAKACRANVPRVENGPARTTQ